MKELTLVNKLREAAITVAVPAYIYNNYVLSGDRAEVDYYLDNELPTDNPDVLRRIKHALCKDDNETKLYDYIIVDDEDQNFMDIKESELKILMGNDYVGVEG